MLDLEYIDCSSQLFQGGCYIIANVILPSNIGGKKYKVAYFFKPTVIETSSIIYLNDKNYYYSIPSTFEESVSIEPDFYLAYNISDITNWQLYPDLLNILNSTYTTSVKTNLWISVYEKSIVASTTTYTGNILSDKIDIPTNSEIVKNKLIDDINKNTALLASLTPAQKRILRNEGR